MDVARRAIALAGECFDQRESSLRLVTGGRKVSSQPVYQNESWRAPRPRPNGASRSASAVVLRGVVMVGFLSMKSTLRIKGS